MARVRVLLQRLEVIDVMILLQRMASRKSEPNEWQKPNTSTNDIKNAHGIDLRTDVKILVLISFSNDRPAIVTISAKREHAAGTAHSLALDPHFRIPWRT